MTEATDGPEGPLPRTHPGQRPREQHGVRELLRFVPDIARLLWDLTRDPRVPWYSKAIAGGALAYVASPVDVLPDFLPGLGQLDDLYLVVWALRHLVASAGYDVVRDAWKGSDDGFALLLVVAGIHR